MDMVLAPMAMSPINSVEIASRSGRRVDRVRAVQPAEEIVPELTEGAERLLVRGAGLVQQPMASVAGLVLADEGSH